MSRRYLSSVFHQLRRSKQHARNKWIKARMNNNSDLYVTENSVVCDVVIKNVTKNKLSFEYELKMFEESDKVNFDQLKENLISNNHTFPSDVNSFEFKDILSIKSIFQSFHCGVKVSISLH